MTRIRIVSLVGLLFAAVALVQGVQAQTTLTTTFSSNNGSYSNMFNVTALNGTITITRFDTHSSSTAALTYQIYTKSGTYRGSEHNSAAWTLHDTVTTTGAGTGNPTNVTLNVPLTIPTSTTTGIYMYNPADNRYTTGTGAAGTPNLYQDSFVQIDCGCALVGFFTGTINDPRIWNGTIHYNVGGNPAPTLTPSSGSSFNAARSVSVTVGNALSNANLSANDFNDPNINITVTSSNPAPGVTAPSSSTGTAVPATLSWTGTPTTAGTYTYSVMLDDGTSTPSYTVTIVVDPVQNVPYYLYYKFNEGSGTTTANSANPGVGATNPTFSLSTGWESAPQLGASALDLKVGTGTAGTGYLDSGWSMSIANTLPFTVEFWCRRNVASATTLQYLCGDNNAATFRIYMSSASILVAGGGFTTLTGTGVAVNDGNWHHIAFVYAPATSQTFLYIDGVQRATASSQTSNINSTSTATGFIVGSYTTTAARFDGDIDEFRLWRMARTVTEVSASMNTELPLIDSTMLTASGGSVAMNTPVTNLAAMNIQASTYVNNNSINSITFSKTGSVTDAQISSVDLYRDNNSSGTVDGGDTLLQTGTLSSGQVTYSGAPLQALATGVTTRLILAATIPGTLAAGSTLQFNISSAAFSGGTDMTSYPVNGTSFFVALNGNYTINQTSGDFTSIGAAFDALEAYGVTGPVTLTITDSATYTSNASYSLGCNASGTVITPVAGASATNTITLRAATGQTPIVQGNSTGAVLIGQSTTSPLTGRGGLVINHSYVTVEGLEVTGGPNFGIMMQGNNITGLVLITTNITVRNCKVHSIPDGPGIAFMGQNGAYFTNGVIENNFVWDCFTNSVPGTSVILTLTYGSITVRNAANASGIVRHNTIVHTSTFASTGGIYAFSSTTTYPLNNVNSNIVVSTNTGVPAIFLNSTTSAPTVANCNRNIWFASTICNQATLDTWTEWQNSGRDTGGSNQNPLLVSTSGTFDLHLQGNSPAIDLAFNSTIASDIDGQSRPLDAARDSGADERAATGQPEINAQRGASIADGGTDNLGDVYTVATQFTYVIQNSGQNNLIVNTPVVLTPVTGAPTLSVVTQPANVVFAGGSTNLVIQVTPALGTFSFTISFTNSDSDEGTYDFTVSGNGVTPEMDVSRSAAIVDGGTDSLGSVATSGASFTWTIDNTGTGNLLLTTPITVTPGTGSPSVTVTAQPGNTVGPSGSTTFTVQVSPVAGAFTFTISIANNDQTENPYNWTVDGTGIGPEMGVSRAAAIADGGTESVGNIPTTGQTFTWTIANTGNTTLSITTPITVTPGTGTPGVTVTTQPAGSVTAAGTTTFDIQIVPAMGAFSFTVSIANDDANENPYNWTVNGTGQAAEIDVLRGSSIADGGTDNLNTVLVSGASFTWTILNTGNIALSITTPITVTPGTGSPSVTVTAQPAASVAGGTGTTFTIQVIPAVGAFDFAVSITNSDSNESPYDFTVSGTGADPEMDVLRGAAIADGGTDSLGTVPIAGMSFIWTIQNSGSGDLTISTPITVTPGTGSPSVTVTSQPSNTVVQGSSTTFTIMVTPATGAFDFAVSISSNDINESPYNFTVDGTGDSPEMDVVRGTSITDGGTDSLSFVPTAGASFVWTISNGGPVDLNLATPITVTPGTGTPGVTVTAQPASTVGPTGSTTFTILVTPAAGAFDFTVSIANDDPNENPYDFTVDGVGNSAALANTATGSSFAGSTNGPFTQALVPGATLANADIELTDAEGDTITVTAITPVTAAPTGIAAPGVPGAGQPITLSWTGTANASNPSGDYTWEVTFMDSVNGTSVTVDVTITIGDLPPVHSIASASGGDGSAANPYTAEYTETLNAAADIDLANVSDPNTGQTLTISATNPGASNPAGGAGFTLMLAGGMLNLAPASALVAADVGVHTFDVDITDGTNTITIAVEVTVAAQPVITTASPLPNGEQGVSYTPVNLATTGGTGTLTFNISAGALPPGITMTTGIIGGMPTLQGSYSFTVTATDNLGVAGSKAFSLTINPPALGNPNISTTSPLASGTVGQVYGPVTIAVTGGTAPYNFAVTSSLLPNGLSLDPLTGVISGTPTTAAMFSFDITVTDSAFASDTQTFQITVMGTGGGNGGGGGGGGGGGCAAETGNSAWALILGMLALLALATRLRAVKD